MTLLCGEAHAPMRDVERPLTRNTVGLCVRDLPDRAFDARRHARARPNELQRGALTDGRKLAAFLLVV
jgi:hypothetical protein